MSEPDSRRGRARRRFTVDSLFTDTRQRAVGVDELVDAKLIAIERIVPDPNQPRRTFDPERLEELADSIRQQGILQPIVVRYEESGDRYVIVHGERRWRAAKQAGTASIPALVRDIPADRDDDFVPPRPGPVSLCSLATLRIAGSGGPQPALTPGGVRGNG